MFNPFVVPSPEEHGVYVATRQNEGYRLDFVPEGTHSARFFGFAPSLRQARRAMRLAVKRYPIRRATAQHYAEQREA